MRATCWQCSSDNDEQTVARGEAAAVPGPGDVLICFYCGAVSVVDDAGGSRRATEAEVVEVLEQSDAAIAAIVRRGVTAYRRSRSRLN